MLRIPESAADGTRCMYICHVEALLLLLLAYLTFNYRLASF
jgi:hypothetical protein